MLGSILPFVASAAAYEVTILILLLATVFASRELLTYGPGGTLPTVPASIIGSIGLWLLSTVAALSIWMRAVREPACRCRH